jgi:hypothetical protein
LHHNSKKLSNIINYKTKMIMKKTNFFYAAAIALVSAFGMTSCSVEDNPASDPTQPQPAEPTIVEVSLQDVPFCTWSAFVGGEATGAAGCAWVVGESTGLPYGDGNVINYSDLSEYSKLLVVATAGTPRFLLNRDIDNGQWNEDESQSHLIEYPKGDEVWSAKYFSVEEVEGGQLFTVDLAQIVKDKGYAHLHSIKGANWVDCTVTSMILVKVEE